MSDDVEPSQAEPLRVEAKYDGPHVTIVVEGELDVSGARELQACVSEALERLTWDRSITIDVHGLTYTDSSGLAGLLRARAASHEVAVAFRISEPSPALRRLTEMAGVPNLLPDE
ncbi:MAG TPA: STAS domain-containing protein [Acidimicrobiales bacterium]|nr:STAS domain-containing protein [Acidimicrobiales bacterium]